MEYLPFISLALFNGLLIAGVRVTNANLGQFVSSAGASIWNHLTGFLALALIVPRQLGTAAIDLTGAPYYLYLGGILGAIYIALNNVVIPRLGAAKTTMIVIAGQIIFGALLDFAGAGMTDIAPSVAGIALVVLGMWIGYRAKGDPSTRASMIGK